MWFSFFLHNLGLEKTRTQGKKKRYKKKMQITSHFLTQKQSRQGFNFSFPMNFLSWGEYVEHSVHVAHPCRTNVCMGPAVVLFPVPVSQRVNFFYSYSNWLIIRFLLKLSLGGSIHRFGVREFSNIWNLLLQGTSNRKYFLGIIKKIDKQSRFLYHHSEAMLQKPILSCIWRRKIPPSFYYGWS